MLLLFSTKLVACAVRRPGSTADAAHADGSGSSGGAGDLRRRFRSRVAKLLVRHRGGEDEFLSAEEDAFDEPEPPHRQHQRAIVQHRDPTASLHGGRCPEIASAAVPRFEAQDLGRLFGPLHDKEHAGGGPARQQARRLDFEDLRAVLPLAAQAGGVQLTTADGLIHFLPLGLVCQPVQEAFVAGLHSAMDTGVADWSAVHEALQADLWARPMRSAGGEQAGRRILEIFEVERWRPKFGQWATSTLPVDRELKWRWVDASGNRHPNLFQGITCEEAAACKGSPPCEPMSRLFEPDSAWTIVVNQDTDADGWSYSIAWNSAVWDPSPNLFAAIRKRRWLRTYA